MGRGTFWALVAALFVGAFMEFFLGEAFAPSCTNSTSSSIACDYQPVVVQDPDVFRMFPISQAAPDPCSEPLVPEVCLYQTRHSDLDPTGGAVLVAEEATQYEDVQIPPPD
jgi:hypothetical protein